MSDRNQRKLVDAFKTFFQKSVYPYVQTNEQVMNEWKYFSRLITTQPIDYNQVQFYILLANKNSVYAGQQDLRNNSFNETQKYNQNYIQNSANKIENSDKKSNNSQQVNSPKKNLVTCLENFHTLMLKNQQKLQSICRKDVPTSPAAYPTMNNTTYPTRRFY